MDVAAWLRDLGLERYAASFQDAEITPEALPELTDADLRELGLPLGPRKVLLKALQALAAPHPPPVGIKEEAAPWRARTAPSQAERRQLTVMFVDLVGSTTLSTQLDPEELGEVIQAYQAAVAAEITRLDGHVAKFMGDGVLAYFGWPMAHEDEPERAVRVGLAATAAVARLATPSGEPLAARVGIATGLVVVGDLIGEGAAQEEAVVGETPNLAARLQALAEPGTVVVAGATHRLLGQMFEIADLGTHDLPGFADPVAAFRVTAARTAKSRFEAMHGHHLTPLVEREGEIGLLLDRWRQARGNEGQVVLVAGEPGIGKSRLLQALCDRLADEPHTCLRYFGSPYHLSTAFHPILDQIERAAGLDRDDLDNMRLDKLEALFAPSGGRAAEATALTASLLGIPTEGRYPPSSLGPQGRRAKLQEVWLEQLAGLASRRPVLMLVEDAHWIDPTSLEQFDLLVQRLPSLPILLVVTFRPEFQPPWLPHGHVTTLSLERFDSRQSAALVERVMGKALPAPVREQIVARADGVPLFLEELAKTVLESGQLEDVGWAWQLRGPLPALAIPATLHDSLLARLDRLAPIKEVAQTAAAIGREFPRNLVAAVSGLDEPTLNGALEQLGAAELIFQHGAPSDLSYSFKHALVRDAAYATLLHGRRRLIHGRIAAVLLEGLAEHAPEIVAHHLTEAGDADRSVEFWAQAGQQAVERAASKEAVAHFRQALSQLLALPESDERQHREATLQSALGAALVHVTGPASDPLAQAHARARDLYRNIGDGRAQFIAEWNLWHVYYSRAEYGEAQALADHLMAVAERERDQDLVLQACHVEWVALGTNTDYVATLACCERGWALYDIGRHGSHAFTFGAHDPGVCSRNHAATALWFLGRPDRARASHEQALALARKLDHPLILVNALARGLPLLQRLRDRHTLEAQAAATVALATEQGFPNYRIDAEILRAWALHDASEPGAAARLIRAGLNERQRLKSMWLNPYFLSLLADVLAREGSLDEALETIEQALDEAQTKGHLRQEVDLVRLKGEILRQANDLAAAEECLVSALATARATSARMYELRTATSLARLWADQGRRAEARQLLEPVYNAFDEGLGTPDLQDARTLLSSP